jgi:hypothetical protein
MRMPKREEDRYYMIREALKAKAPKTYRQLVKAGKLEQFVKERDDLMMEGYGSREMQVFYAAMNQAYRENKEYLEAQQESEAALSRLCEETLATYLEFQDPETTESSQES